jgi:hypothetical protein
LETILTIYRHCGKNSFTNAPADYPSASVGFTVATRARRQHSARTPAAHAVGTARRGARRHVAPDVARDRAR